MRVDFTNYAPEPPEQAKPGRSGQSGAAGASSASAGTPAGLDQASFSYDGTRVQSLKTQVLAQPEIRQAKVQALQQAISNDQYSVLPGQIAEALASELGGAQG